MKKKSFYFIQINYVSHLTRTILAHKVIRTSLIFNAFKHLASAAGNYLPRKLAMSEFSALRVSGTLDETSPDDVHKETACTQTPPCTQPNHLNIIY